MKNLYSFSKDAWFVNCIAANKFIPKDRIKLKPQYEIY